MHSSMSNRCDKTYVAKPILSGRIGKWAYALIEYDLASELLKSMKGQIVADFIVEHQIDDEHDLEIGYIFCTPWKLYFDGSVCHYYKKHFPRRAKNLFRGGQQKRLGSSITVNEALTKAVCCPPRLIK